MLRQRTLDEMFEFVLSDIRAMEIDKDAKSRLIGYITALRIAIEGQMPYSEPTHTNPEDTYREDFGSYVEESKRVEATCKVKNVPVDERNDGEPINVSTEGKHGLKWSCELEDCSFSPNMTRHFDSIESAEKYADGVLTKGIAKGVTIRRLEW